MPTQSASAVLADDTARELAPENAQSSGVDVSGIDLPGMADLARRPDGSVPGPVVAAFLSSIDPADLESDAQVLDAVQLTDRLKSWADALHLTAVAEFVRRPDIWPVPEPAAAKAGRRPLGRVARAFPGDEIAARLGVTCRAGDNRIAMACALVGRLPQTLAALRAGHLDFPRAMAMSDETVGCDDEHAAAVESAVLERGRRATPGRFGQAVRRAVLTADPEAARQRAQRARDELDVQTSPRDTDTATLQAHMQADDAAAVRSVLDAAATTMARREGETRTRGQLRAAALAAPFWAALSSGELVTPDGPLTLTNSHGQAPAVELLLTVGSPEGCGVPAASPEGLETGAEAADSLPSGRAVKPVAQATLQGYGPITPELARALESRVRPGRRAVVHVISPVTADEAEQIAQDWPVEPGYRPSAALVRHIIARDVTCPFPVCSRAAARADLDHTRPWPGGPTHPRNLSPPCRRHHRMKQHPAVQLEQPRPGQFVWTLPTGHTYSREPADPG